MSNLSEVFDDIYRNDRWGNGSGPGSNMDEAWVLVRFINASTAPHHVTTFLDIGCGDGQLAQWYECSKYLGVDVSQEALDRFVKATRRPTVCMNAADAMWNFDFVLIKDVLQHLPLNECHRLLQSVSKCRRVWVVNDLPDANQKLECEPGGYRPINPRVLEDSFKPINQFRIAGFEKVVWEWWP